MEGFIFLHRQIQDTWIWDMKNPLFYIWWSDLLLLANYRDREIAVARGVMTLRRGQLIASVSYLQQRWMVGSNHTVIRFLDRLRADNMITTEVHSGVRGKINIITICNYDKYQSLENDDVHSDVHSELHSEMQTAVHSEMQTKEKGNKGNKVKTDNNILTHTNACARIEKDEEAYVNEAKSSGEFLEQLQRQFRITDPQRFVSLIDAFNTECKAYDKRHTSHKDFRQKFTWWVGDKLQGTFPSVQVVSSMLNAESIAHDWPLMEAYTGYFDLVRKANLTNYMYQLDILRPRQYADLVMERGFSPQEVWQATTELNNNVRYCRDHQSAYECLITFCQSNRNNPNRR